MKKVAIPSDASKQKPLSKKAASQSLPTSSPADSALPEDTNVYLPEWTDIDEKYTSKQAFEDPDGLPLLPRHLKRRISRWARPVDFIEAEKTAEKGNEKGSQGGSHHGSQMGSISTGLAAMSGSFVVVCTSSNVGADGQNGLTGMDLQDVLFNVHDIPRSEEVGDENNVEIYEETEESQAVPNDAETILDGEAAVDNNNSATLSNELQQTEKSQTSLPKSENELAKQADPFGSACLSSYYFEANRHLMGSELSRNILLALYILMEQSKLARSHGLVDDFAPWDCIYPKAKDGFPSYNASGKYSVKLFWMGTWRKVTVDDRIPLDRDGRPLFIQSPLANELWPLILTKALFKVAAYSYTEHGSMAEHGDFNSLYVLKGYMPEDVKTSFRDEEAIWRILSEVVSSDNANGFPTLTGNFQPPISAQSVPATASTEKSKQPATAPVPVQSYLKQYNPFSTLFARRQEFSNHVGLAPGLYRIINVTEEDIMGEVQRFVHFRSYFVGYPEAVADRFDSETQEFSDYLLPFSEFLEVFSGLVYSHSPGRFKFGKSVVVIPNEPTKVTPDSITKQHILYFSGDEQVQNIFVSLQTLGRCRQDDQLPVSVLIEKYNWKEESSKTMIMKFASNGVVGTIFRAENCGSPAQAYKVTVEANAAYILTFHSSDEVFVDDEMKYLVDRLKVSVKDLEDTYLPQIPNTWSILFKFMMKVPQSTFLSTRLTVPPAIQPFVTLHVIDCDKRVEMPTFVAGFVPQTLTPNEKGYLVYADCKVPSAATSIPAGKFKLKLLSESCPLEIGPDLSLKPNVVEIEDTYTPNRHNILFRYFVKTKDVENFASAQLTYNVPSNLLRLQFLDNDQEICSVQGRSVITIPWLPLTKDDEPARDARGHKQNSGAAPKHKYVLQGVIEFSELSKVGGSVNTLNEIRPASSRVSTAPMSSSSTKNKDTSAKKKKGGPEPTQASSATVSGSASLSANEPSWKLRIVSSGTSNVALVKDTEREDKFKAIKDGWESSQPGRAAKGRDSRDQFLRMLQEQGRMILDRTRLKSASLHAPKQADPMIQVPALVGEDFRAGSRVPAAEELAAREVARKQRTDQMAAFLEEARRARVEDKEKRGVFRAEHLKPFQKLHEEVVAVMSEDRHRVDAYRTKMVKLLDEASKNRPKESTNGSAMALDEESDAARRRRGKR